MHTGRNIIAILPSVDNNCHYNHNKIITFIYTLFHNLTHTHIHAYSYCSEIVHTHPQILWSSYIIFSRLSWLERQTDTNMQSITLIGICLPKASTEPSAASSQGMSTTDTQTHCRTLMSS